MFNSLKVRWQTSALHGLGLLTAIAFAVFPSQEGAAQSPGVPIAFTAGSLPADGVQSMDACDFDQDGFLDVIAFASNRMSWLKNPGYAPASNAWTAIALPRPSVERPFKGAARAADMDGDGDCDFVVSMDNHSGDTRSAYVYLYLNQGGQPLSWTINALARNIDVHHINDMRLADLDGDSRLDVIVRGLTPNRLHLFFQNSVSSWTHKSIDSSFAGSTGEGMAVGNIDGQGYIDITVGGYWLRAPADPRVQGYSRYTIDGGFHSINANVKEAVGDLDGDGDLDLVLSAAESFRAGRNHILAWYRNPGGNATGSWGPPIVIESNFNEGHGLHLADMNNDGWLDIVSGVAWGSKRIRVYFNRALQAESASRFSPSPGYFQDVSREYGLYSGAVADFDGDGDIDIVGEQSYQQRLRVYESHLVDGQVLLPVPDPTPGAEPEPQPIPQPTPVQKVLALGFDEGAGTVCTDAGTRALDCRISGAGWTTDTADGSAYALSFTGNSRVNLPAFDIGGGEMTISAWIRADDVGNEGRIISKASGTADAQHNFMVSVYGADKLRFRLDAGGSVTTLVGSTPLEAGVWTHVAAVYDGAAMSLYVNGYLDERVSKTGPIRSADGMPVAIGNQPAGAGERGFIGLIDRVTIHDRALSAVELTETWANPPPGEPAPEPDPEPEPGQVQVLALGFDEGAGTVCTDAGARALECRISGAGWTTDTADGSPYALSFTGNSRVDVTAFDIGGGEMTISAWIRADDVGNEGRIISKASGTGNAEHNFMVSVYGADKLRFRLDAGGSVTTLVGSTPLEAGVWTHVAAVYDGAAMSLYVNGYLDERVSKTGPIRSADGMPVAIGNQPAGAGERGFIGLIDRVTIHDRALSAAELKDQSSGP